MPKKYINPCNEKIIGPKVCLVYFPWASKVPYKFISEILEILEPISHSILLIGGNVDRLTYLPSNLKVFNINIGMHYQKDIKPRNYSILLWVIKCVFVQVKTSFALFNERKNYDKVVFYMAHPYHFMPLVFTSLLKKKIT